jgi:carboxymethylenebutenolidase
MSRKPDPSAPSARPVEFPREVWSLFDQYVHGDLDRRGFLAQVGRFATAGWTAATILDALSPRFAEAAEVAADDPRIERQAIEFTSRDGYGRGRGLLAVPKSPAGKRPGVLVIHENRGLNPHIEDIALRVALAGYVAFAPDALFPLGGYPGDEDRARALFATLDQTKTTEDFVAALDFLKRRPECNGTVGAVGFCYGGGMAGTLAVRVPELVAAVPFYGSQPKPEDVPKIRAAIQCHYAAMDDRINAGIPAFEAALKTHGIRHQIFVYPGTQHGFNNNTTPRFDKAAAALAWSRTLDFFKRTLGA